MAAAVALFLLALSRPAATGEADAGVVEVARGRSVFLQREQLSFRAWPDARAEADAHCKVEVVLHEPMTQRVGRLTPQVFDCNFLPEEVAYRHNGSPLLDTDRVLLRIYWLGPSRTRTERAALHVRVTEPPPGGLAELGSSPLEVPRFYALSNAIDHSVVRLRIPGEAACAVRALDVPGAPVAGRLVFGNDDVQRKGREAAPCPGNRGCARGAKEAGFLKASCQDFLTLGIRYQHLSPPSPDLDYVVISVELRQPDSRDLLEAQTLWLPVRIAGAAPNQPPRAALSASLLLEVDQFVLTPVTTAALDAQDPETPREGLLFRVSAPPPRGFLTHLDGRGDPAGSFLWSDLRDLKVAYQPPNASRPARDNFQMEFRAVDERNASSAAIALHVSIRPAETDAPRVSWNRGLDLLEGQSRAITWEELQIVDHDDNEDSVSLVAVDGPAHGTLSVRGAKSFTFTVRDLREGAVLYHHSDSDSTSDRVVFRIGDGRHSLRHSFPIRILPRDDAPPFLVNNVALEVAEGGALRLEPSTLLASDLDSDDGRILFRVDVPPRAGRILKRTSLRDPGVPVSVFVQRELTRGLIFYRHSGEEIFRDSFDVTLSDGQSPPNLSPPYTVAVSVFPVEDQLPAEAPGSVRHLTLKETQVAYITRAHLHFSHAEHPHSDLTYTVTRPCFGPGNPGLMDAGRLFYVDGSALGRDPLTPALKSFTQHAVDHLKVAYMPPVEDIGPDPLAVQFVFSVGDHRGGGAVTDLLFNISVTPVDDQPPEAFSNLLRVEEGGWAFVTEEHLRVRDRDTLAHHLRVELERPARHGRLELRGRSLRVFTLADLKERAVRYLHDDSETTEDDVGLRVTDGVNGVLVDLPVQVVPVNDQPPRLGPGLRGDLRCPEGGRVQLTADYLAASDDDDDGDDERLSYVLARRPLGGHLRRAGIPVDKFSQRDLLRGHVFYVHAGEEIGPAPVVDTLTLIISDGEAGAGDVCCPGDAPPVPLHGALPVYHLNVTLLPVNNKVPAVILGASVLAVDEGSRACLCGGLLGARDADSAPEELTFHLDAEPLHGFLENVQPTPGYEKSNAGIPIERFTWTELTSGSINYVQSRHRGAEPTQDRLLISVSDGPHRSASVPLAVLVRPVNDEEPRLRLADFTVKEGGARELTPALLDAWDLDAPPDELTFTLTGVPEHGALTAGEAGHPLPAGSSFTLRQLRDGLTLCYRHDDSESPEDRLALRLSDGVHSLHAAAAIGVLPVDDHPPRLVENAGVEVEPGARRVISAAVLRAEDADTPPAALFYLLDAAPRLGKLHLKEGAGQRELEAGHNFTQDDVDENRLSYAAWAHARGHDGFGFGLSDLRHPSPAHLFNITIHAPYAGDVSLQIGPLRVAQGGRAVLDTDCLRARDGVGRPDRLLYAVTTAPRHGLLHRLARPGVPLLSFTQMDVAARRVCYAHDNGRGDSGDSFSLTVSNGEQQQSGTVQVTVVAVDRVPATLESNEGMGVAQGGTAPITWRHLQLSDAETPPSELLFRLIRAPRFGRLLLRGVPLNAGPSADPPNTVAVAVNPLNASAAGAAFSQADVDGGHLAYRHEAEAGPPRDDAFAFLPGDGRNPGYLRFGQLRTVEAVFHIHVEPVDRTPPVLTALGRPSEVVRLSDGRYAVFVTSKHLRAADDRAPSDQLIFTVLKPPTYGHLENVRTGAYVRGRFTQRDVESRSLVFVLPADGHVTEDGFVFGLSDPAGNAAPPQTLTVSWSRIQLAAQSFRICETAGALEIPLLRSGASAEPAYVAVRVRDGTAKAARDFTHSTASLVQFDPGVGRKTWSVYPRADGLEENDEDLSVELSRPHNAVLGRVTSARVLILDPRGGKCDMGAKEEAPPPPPPPLPLATSPPPPAITGSPPKEDNGVLEVEAELLWESAYPPRGDVPGREAFLDDQPAAGAATTTTAGVAPPRRRESAPAGPEAAPPGVGKVWTFHSLTSLRLEEDRRPAAAKAARRRTPRREVARKRTTCPDGWSGHKGRCYLAASSPGSWAGARRACSLLSTGGALASVRSGRQLRWLWKFGGGKPFWMGGAATTTTTTTGQRTGWSCFLASHPRRWTSADCRSDARRHAFICETPAVPSAY
ncbi:FRAS1-related extracellular matrix protein 1b isoform X2 [Stigmatopora nigra]